jgi:DMSO/TMAO reductase YedYZ molybdopterin-dependent catalytic subunit
VRCDIHCVTKWSKLGTSFAGVSVDVLLEGVDPQGDFAMGYTYGGYTTNLALVLVEALERGADFLGNLHWRLDGAVGHVAVVLHPRDIAAASAVDSPLQSFCCISRTRYSSRSL